MLLTFLLSCLSVSHPSFSSLFLHLVISHFLFPISFLIHLSFLSICYINSCCGKQDVEQFTQRFLSPPVAKTCPTSPWPHWSPGNGHTAVHQGLHVTPLPCDLNTLMFENCACPEQETAQVGHGMSLVTRTSTGRKKSEWSFQQGLLVFLSILSGPSTTFPAACCRT